MGRYVIATTKSWNINNYERLVLEFPEQEFCLITQKEDLTIEFLGEFAPKYIFFPHWSWIIPKDIYEKYECVVFHMTDLPFGRGGSPLQNLIIRGIYETKISAIKVEEGLDTGPIYMKEEIDISEGNADQIFKRISDIVYEKMIPVFLKKSMIPKPQEGEVVLFKRRTPRESELPKGLSKKQIYDYIRMLDGEGYPRAYIDIDDMRIYLKDAKYCDEKLFAETIIEMRDK